MQAIVQKAPASLVDSKALGKLLVQDNEEGRIAQIVAQGPRRALVLAANALRVWASCIFFVAAAVGSHANAETSPVATQVREKSRMCEGCHGVADYNNAFPDVYRVPKLGEQQAAYIIKALQDYKSGARPHATMRSIAATLTDQDMADLAAYYSAPPVVSPRKKTAEGNR